MAGRSRADVCCKHLAPLTSLQLPNIAAQRQNCRVVLLDEHRVGSASRESFQPECAGARKSVEHTRSPDNISTPPRGVEKHVEGGLPYSICRWPSVLTHRADQPPPSPGSADNSH